MKQPRILILGAGPTGLGAASRLHEMGHQEFVILERENHPGGLAASFQDSSGFVWDVGGHVQFSHYEYFDRMMDRALGDRWVHHRREAYIQIQKRFVPYPLQNNLRYLPREVAAECLLGLLRAGKNHGARPAHFAAWIQASFGDGIARHFLLPYNAKVWAQPLEQMSYSWIGERVATVSLEKALENFLLEKDDATWGPNESFRFPLQGGTGAVWRAVAASLPADSILYGARVESIDAGRRRVRTADGASHSYDFLISSLPLDRLGSLLGDADLSAAASGLRHSAVHVVGVGLAGEPPDAVKTKCWMYFPEAGCPFHRVTVFSRYSPNNVPPGAYWSLMAEVSESEFKPIDRQALIGQTLEAFYRIGLASPEHRVVSTWSFCADPGYPTPTLDRDQILGFIQPRLESRDIFSRGRFGGWKYEVSNQDHCAMQGVEVVNRILRGAAEMTYPDPAAVNNRPAPVPLE